jgi:hypothetical protein
MHLGILWELDGKRKFVSQLPLKKKKLHPS